MLSKYQKIGLRQDKNLSDLDNRSLALDNLLNNLSENFNGQDIKTAIDGLRNTDVTLEDIYNLLGFAIRDSDSNPIPTIVTIQDHINNYRVFSGNPAFARGGQGMPARFIPGSDLKSIFYSTDNGDELYGTLANSQIEYNWWDDGYFNFDTKLHPFLSDQYGLVQWEGYASQLTKVMTISTSGFFIVETNVLEDDAPFSPSNWTIRGYRRAVRRLYNVTKASAVSESTWTGDPIIGPNGETYAGAAEFGIGDRLVEINGTDVSNDNITITSFDPDTGEWTLSTPVDFISGNNTLYFEYDFGNEPVTSFFSVPQTVLGDKIKIRISVYWPDPAITNATNFNGVEYTQTGPLGGRFARKEIEIRRQDSDWCHYSHFYENYTRNDDLLTLNGVAKESFEEFYKGALSYNSPRMVQKNLISSQSFNLDIDPKIQVDDTYMRIVGGITYVSPFRAVGDFSQAEVGDILEVGTGANRILVSIVEKYSDTEIGTQNYWATQGSGIEFGIGFSLTCRLIKADGLIGVYTVTVLSGSSIRLTEISGFDAPDIPHSSYSDAGKIKNDMFVHVGISGTAVARITDVEIAGPGRRTVYWSNFGGNTANMTPVGSYAYVYARRGLEDSTNAQKCEGVSYVETNATYAAGGNSFVVLDASNANIGDYVQFAGIIDSKFTGDAVDTTITNKVGNTLTISRPLKADLSLGFAITVIPASKFNTGTPTDYEICTIPPNTAPPFEGTDAGLRTSNNAASSNYKLKVSDLKTNRLTLKSMTVASETAESPTYSETLRISDGVQNYYLLLK